MNENSLSIKGQIQKILELGVIIPVISGIIMIIMLHINSPKDNIAYRFASFSIPHKEVLVNSYLVIKKDSQKISATYGQPGRNEYIDSAELRESYFFEPNSSYDSFTFDLSNNKMALISTFGKTTKFEFKKVQDINSQTEFIEKIAAIYLRSEWEFMIIVLTIIPMFLSLWRRLIPNVIRYYGIQPPKADAEPKG